MAKKFYSKGKGANRKVIPISDKKGGSKSVNVISIAYPLERMSEPEREFEASKEYVYKKLDDVEDFIELSRNFDEFDFKKYPGLKKADGYLKDSEIIAKNAVLNTKLLMKKHGGGVGPLVQSIHNSIHEIIKLNYEAYMDLDEIIKKARKENGDSENCMTHEGYSLPSLMADITEMEEDLYDADSVLTKTFRNMRRAQYREYKMRAANNVIDSHKEQGHGQFRVTGDISMLYNPDGSLKIRGFSRETF